MINDDLTEEIWHRLLRGRRQMINVDFRRAQLHDVGFRGLSMDKVIFPEDGDHVVIDDYPAVLERMVCILLGQGDRTARGRELVDQFVETLGAAAR